MVRIFRAAALVASAVALKLPDPTCRSGKLRRGVKAHREIWLSLEIMFYTPTTGLWLSAHRM